MARFLLLQEEHIFLLLVLLVFLVLIAIIVIFFFITLSQFVEKVKIMLSPEAAVSWSGPISPTLLANFSTPRIINSSPTTGVSWRATRPAVGK